MVLLTCLMVFCCISFVLCVFPIQRLAPGRSGAEGCASCYGKLASWVYAVAVVHATFESFAHYLMQLLARAFVYGWFCPVWYAAVATTVRALLWLREVIVLGLFTPALTGVLRLVSSLVCG